MSSSSSPAAGDGCSKTTVSAETVTGSHVLEVKGYSATKGIGVGKSIDSGEFRAGGQTWYIQCYPDGFDEENANYVSVFLHIHHSVSNSVRARFQLTLLNDAGNPVPKYLYATKVLTFSSTGPSWGYPDFIGRKELESSSSLKDDSFGIRCDVTVIKEIRRETTGLESITVPSPDLHLHLRDLLNSKVGGDVTFDVKGVLFTAHRYVLATRSTVFMAELFGPMEKAATTTIRIHDMEARVFKAFLHFIYTDSLPEMDDCDKLVMAQHLLVAADRYNMERLKLICEDMLCSYIDMDIVATTLVLADQHGCDGLKKACFKFLGVPGNLKAIMASDGFQHLKTSCPSLLEELLHYVAP